MKRISVLVLCVCFSGLAALQAGVPDSIQWVRLLSVFDKNRDQQLSSTELGSMWYGFGKYDFNRNGQLTKKEFEEKRIPPAIKK